MTEVENWLQKIAAYDQEFKSWEARVDKILKKYKDDRGPNRGETARFNILWSNVQTIVPATFSRLPKPDVSRRFRDNDPVGRVASMMLERALEFEIEHYHNYRAAMKNSVYDRFLGGRGTAWVRYEPHIRAAKEGMPEDGLQITEDANDDIKRDVHEELDCESAPEDYVNWKDFGHTVARTWEEVTAVWRRVYLSRAALVKRFGEEIGGKIPLDTRPDDTKNHGGIDEATYQACIYEIWDKESMKAIWLSKSMGKIINEKEDPLELESFFPCPRPLFATLTSDSLVPTPDYVLYQDQAEELNILCDRIDGLIKALQIRGVYDDSIPALARILTEGENNTLIPVKNWMAFAEKQGLKGAIDLIDISPIAATLIEAYKAMEQVKGQIYEITGISDLQRGDTDPNETAAAQNIKGQYSSLRLKTMQGDVAQYAAELLQIKAQIICKKFSPETIVKISAAMQMSPEDQQLIPQALQLLKDEPLRNFRIEVSSDSMVFMDESQEKSDRMEFLTATGSFLQKALPVIQASPQIAPLLVELLKFGVTAFKVGKSIEGQFDAALDMLVKEAKNPQPRPNPEMMKIQAEAQAQQQEMQMKMQIEQQSLQAKMQLEQHKQEMQAQQIQQQNQIEAQREHLAAQNEAQLEQLRMAMEQRMGTMQEQMALLIAKLNNEAKIEVEEIKSATVLQAAQISSARQAENSSINPGE